MYRDTRYKTQMVVVNGDTLKQAYTKTLNTKNGSPGKRQRNHFIDRATYSPLNQDMVPQLNGLLLDEIRVARLQES